MTLKFPKGCTRVEATHLSLQFFDRIQETSLRTLENSLLAQASTHNWSASDIGNLLDEARAEWRAERPKYLRHVQEAFDEVVQH